MSIRSIALFCGSAEGANPLYGEVAALLGAMCADKGLTLYYGGACLGLMNKAADAAMARHGRVVGIAPSFFSKNVVLAKDISEMIMVNSMSERKQMMEKLADAFVVLPGAYGTMDEFFELITDAQLGMHHKPVAVLNVNGYYDHLLALLDRFEQDGFLRPFHHELLVVAATLEELFDKLENYQNTNDHQWLKHIKE
ncbi:MAG: TIGR00730 family Rossman fold protein [Bacteroidales bacterium]|nr:TIGR00730 family Rossman fold protein [Bacteroidales bacterium]